MRIFYLGYEIARREFLSNLFISIKLLENKSVDKVVLANTLILKYLFKFRLMPKGAVFHKSAQIYTHSYLKNLKRKGFFNILQDAESVSYHTQDDHIDPFMKPPEAFKYIDLFCSINEEENQTVKNFSKNTKVINTGFTRFWPFSNEEFTNTLFDNEINSIKQKYGKNILYLSSSTAFRYHSVLKNSEEVYKYLRFNDAMSESHAQLIIKWAEYGQYSLFSLLEFIRIFNEKYEGEINFIYRPHPSEDTKFIKRLFNSIPFIKISSKNSLHASILAADSVICSTLSTTIFDSYFLNKLINVYAPYSSSDYYKKLLKDKSFKIARTCNSPEKLLENVTKDIDKSYPFKIDKNIYKLDKKDEIYPNHSIFVESIKKISIWKSIKTEKSLNTFLPYSLKFVNIIFNFYLNIFSFIKFYAYTKNKHEFNPSIYLSKLSKKYKNIQFKRVNDSLIITRK